MVSVHDLHMNQTILTEGFNTNHHLQNEENVTFLLLRALNLRSRKVKNLRPNREAHRSPLVSHQEQLLQREIIQKQRPEVIKKAQVH